MGFDAAIQSTGKVISRVATAAGVILFLAMFLTFMIKIVARHFGLHLPWADDLAIILFLWMMYVSNACVVDERQQITFDLFYNHLQERGRRFVLMLRMTIVLSIFLTSAYGSVDYILFLHREVTSTLEWRLDIIFSCFALFLGAMILRYAYRLSRLLRNQNDNMI